MNKFAILFLLIILYGCSSAPLNRKSGSDTGIKMEEDLKVSIDKYLIENAGKNLPRPVIAATEPELARLKAAWASKGPEYTVLAKRFARADDAIAEGLFFPPEGGQHNQWYQCDSCQRGLITIDAHHHKCPICEKIYSGFPFDNVLYNHKHSQNINRAEDAAWAWIVTGEKKYADFAAAVLNGYAERYLKYPMLHTSVNDKSIDVAAGKDDNYITAGHLQSQTLDEANLMVPVAIAYDLIYNSPSLSDQQKTVIENDFIRPMAECVNAYKSGKSNWQTWHNAALLYAGAVMNDGNMIRQALIDSENGFTAQMKISVMPEGMWYENSWGYHYYTLSAMTCIAEGTRRLGINIYDFPPLKNMYLIAFDYLMADGSLPRFGDAVQDSPFGQEVNEKAYAVYKDERLLSVLSPDISWDAIVLGRDMKRRSELPQAMSRIVPGAGHALLATDGPGRLTAALTFGPFGGFHGHYDKLSFVLFGYGQELGVDPGRAASQAYRLPIHQDWYKSSTGHNIVLVDGKSQQAADGKYLAFEQNGSYAAVTADAGPAFENVSHKRFLLLSPSYLLIIDELISNDGKEHSYDWLYHNSGESVTCSLPGIDNEPGKLPAGYFYLRDIAAYSNESGQAVNVKFKGAKTSLFMKMQGQEGDMIFTATGPLKNVEDRIPLIIVRRKGHTVRFATLLEPVPDETSTKILNFTVIEDDSFSATINHDGVEDHISFPEGSLEKFIIMQKRGSGVEDLLKN